MSDNLQELVLHEVYVDDKDLLKALSRWVPGLLVLIIEFSSLESVSEGRSAILQVLSTMPKLERLDLWQIDEQPGENRIFVRLAIPKLSYDGRREVSPGLRELLAKPLMYEDFDGHHVGQRNVGDHQFWA